MAVLDLICKWCDKNNLTLFENDLYGFHVGCSNPSEANCPDTTGSFNQSEDAINCARDFNEKV